MDIDSVDQIIEKHQSEASALIQVLLDIQAENHWLPQEALVRVSEKLQVPLARIQHIATFYKAFSLVPKGRHESHICVGTACHVRGAPRILQQLEEELNIKEGETTPDNQFTLESVACIGACGLAPAVVINHKTYGHLTAKKISKIIKDIKSEAKGNNK